MEGQASWGDPRELWWVSSWAGDSRRGEGTLTGLALCHDPRAVGKMKTDSSQMCTEEEEAAAMDYSKEKSEYKDAILHSTNVLALEPLESVEFPLWESS